MALKICDVRSAAQFGSLHVKESVNIPLDTLLRLPCALPPRHVPIMFITSTSDEKASCEALAQKMMFADCTVYLFEEIEASRLHELESGDVNRSLRLWDPNELLMSEIERIEHLVGGPSLVFDLGCGTSRDMVFLEHRGWSAFGFDNRKKLVQQAVSMGALHHAHVDVALFHLKSYYPIRHGSVDLVLMSRFLYRPALPEMFLLPRVGGLIVVSHFLDGCQHTTVGTPSTIEGFLMHNELAELCASSRGAAFDIILDEVTTLPDGRPICRFIAQRIG